MIQANWHRGLAALALFVFALPVRAGGPPAFLDSPTEIRVALETPLRQEQLKNAFQVRLDGRAVAISSVKPSGDPVRDRRLARTPNRVILAGTIQAALGGKEWDPDGEVTQMRETRKGLYTLDVELPTGHYEYKVARGGSWNENYGARFEPGGSNIPLEVKKGPVRVRFLVDFAKRRILNSLENPSEVDAPSRIESSSVAVGPVRFGSVVLSLAKPLSNEDVSRRIEVMEGATTRRVFAREILSRPEFSEPGFLGSKWSSTETLFRVWSPVSSSANLVLFDGQATQRLPMHRMANGTWWTRVKGNLNRRLYQYEFRSYGETRLAPDINCFSASPDSKRSMVVDLASTNPSLWPVRLPPLKHQTDAVLYELSVRDFTVSEKSGVDAEKRGKYAGLAQAGTRFPGMNVKTGLDYLVDLGVTHVHLLPVQNFLTGSPNEYTWGYATNLFNVPEETYSVTPNDPIGVIREFKQMVASLHRAGLGVVMDVVYNHTWPPQGRDSAFWQTVPYYYFRTNDRGDLLNESGVGNALNDDHPMVRKFVRDSLAYWVNEYKIDGFRFDLLGMFQPASVRDWEQCLRAIRPDLILYGEPWTGGGPTRFGIGAQRGTGVAVFNDRFRGLIRGETDGSNAGFAMGGEAKGSSLYKAITGWIDSKPGSKDGLTDTPAETINYVSAHDNLTLKDRIAKAIPASEPERRIAALKFAGAAVLLSEGIPFLEGGAEIGRTKKGIQNSYNAGDSVNAFDWTGAISYANVRDYYRVLLAIRRAYPSLRLDSAEAVRKKLHVIPTTATNTIAYLLEGSPNLFVILHGSTKTERITLPGGLWKVMVDGRNASTVPMGYCIGSMPLDPMSAYVFVQ